MSFFGKLKKKFNDFLGFLGFIGLIAGIPTSIGFGAYMIFIRWWGLLPTNGFLMLLSVIWIIGNIVGFIGLSMANVIGGSFNGGLGRLMYIVLLTEWIIGLSAFFIPYFYW